MEFFADLQNQFDALPGGPRTALVNGVDDVETAQLFSPTGVGGVLALGLPLRQWGGRISYLQWTSFVSRRQTESEHDSGRVVKQTACSRDKNRPPHWVGRYAERSPPRHGRGHSAAHLCARNALLKRKTLARDDARQWHWSSAIHPFHYAYEYQDCRLLLL